jgi:uncharacterized protein (TIGR00106 family)
MSREVAVAYEAIRKVKGVSATLTALGTQIEAQSISEVVEAIKQAHEAVRHAGAVRIISSIRIDERLDKNQTLQDKINSVEQQLRGRATDGKLDF